MAIEQKWQPVINQVKIVRRKCHMNKITPVMNSSKKIFMGWRFKITLLAGEDKVVCWQTSQFAGPQAEKRVQRFLDRLITDLAHLNFEITKTKKGVPVKFSGPLTQPEKIINIIKKHDNF